MMMPLLLLLLLLLYVCVHCVICSDVSTLKFTDYTLLRVSNILRQSSANGQICSSSVQTQLLASLAAVLHSLPPDAGLLMVKSRCSRD